MLPKVASHLLHHTSRAVAAVQSQTGHTIRNVLQSGPSSAGNLSGWNGPNASSSGWGSAGSGSGGAKFNSSSRYHSGYASTGRVVSHADPAAANNAVDYSDDTNDPSTSQTVRSSARSSRRSSSRRRVRSTSVSLLPVAPKDQEISLGVLKTVQDHIRARHAFAVPPQEPQSEEHHPITDPIPPTPTKDAEAPQVVDEPSERSQSDQAAFSAISMAEKSGNLARVIQEVEKLGTLSPPPSTALFNAGLHALYRLRVPGEPLHSLLQAYNSMLALSVTPNYRTYAILILALTDRDLETHKAIQLLQNRIKRRNATGTLGGAAQSADEQRIAKLQMENNFGSALTLFQAASLNPRVRPHISVYTNLLRSCVNHANVDAAIHVFAHLEKRTDLGATPTIYGHLISVYTNAGDLQGAEEVFAEYRKAVSAQGSPMGERPAGERWAQISVWNRMIQAYLHCGQPASALGLLEQMMDSPAGVEFGPADVPCPASSTFSTVISGFCHSGDIASAISWFDRLLEQEKSSVHPFEPVVAPTKPDQAAWNAILEALINAGRVHDLNRLFEIALRSKVDIRLPDRISTLRANLHYIESLSDSSEEGIPLLDFVVKKVLEDVEYIYWPAAEGGGPRAICEILSRHYVRFGQPDRAIDLAEAYIQTSRTYILGKEANGGFSGDQVQFRIKGLRGFAKSVSAYLLQGPQQLSLKQLLRIGTLCSVVSISPNPSMFSPYLTAYLQERGSDIISTLTSQEWELLLRASLFAESATTPSDTETPQNALTESAETILVDMASHKVDIVSISKQTRRAIADRLETKLTPSGATSFLEACGPDYARLLGPCEVDKRVAVPSTDSLRPITFPESAPTQHIHVDIHHSSFVDEYYTMRSDMSPMTGYHRFEAGLNAGVYPTPEVIGRLINGVGRLGHTDKVRKLYEAAQLVLGTLEHDKHWQSVGWFQVEDQMVIALAHAGDTDGAHVHRNRIIAEGGAPSADAYGALIQRVKDTTDDTANAMTLFHEAITRGVTPNIYLYNTMISKLAKARKADGALELFSEMKSRGVRPTSVTYGAVIAACCRVGDAQSAEALFKEMSAQPNFRPRVPPYNTMIQLYTHTKPDRSRALYYFDELKKAKVAPTAHTYKLLIDVYGTIEPVDTKAMEDIFERLIRDRQVPVQGTHWAALINAWGCVKKDLEKAIAVFDSIAIHPSKVQSGVKLPDAVCFEALLNVLVTLRRTDLIPEYCERLSSYGIHMTAYIANLLIKGYAAVGDLERSRAVFESLVDPPEGVAAPNNHTPHDTITDASQVPLNAPVFREPSTWEAMVRAELGVGNRDEALALLERVQARRFPPAVYNRISGIMLDDESVSPWGSASSDTSPSL